MPEKCQDFAIQHGCTFWVKMGGGDPLKKSWNPTQENSQSYIKGPGERDLWVQKGWSAATWKQMLVWVLWIDIDRIIKEAKKTELYTSLSKMRVGADQGGRSHWVSAYINSFWRSKLFCLNYPQWCINALFLAYLQEAHQGEGKAREARQAVDVQIAIEEVPVNASVLPIY